MDKQEVQERLVAIARVESSMETVKRLEYEREQLYQTFMRPLDDAIKELQEAPQIMREALKRDVLEYVATTGNTDIHDLIEFRHEMRWHYPKDEALVWCQEFERDCVRIKESLDVRKFEKFLDDGGDNAFDAEKVATPEVAIKKLSHLIE